MFKKIWPQYFAASYDYVNMVFLNSIPIRNIADGTIARAIVVFNDILAAITNDRALATFITK